MIRAVIIYFAFVVGYSTSQKTCRFNNSSQHIDWSKVKKGPWQWALHTPDAFMDNFLCSKVTISGTMAGNEKSFYVSQQYGLLKHQAFRISGSYEAPSIYRVPGFERRWRNVLIHKLSLKERRKIFNKIIHSPQAGLIAFLTDYKNYFITTTCMPTGDVSVVAYTMHKRVSPLLVKRIRGALKQNNIIANPVKLNCNKIILRRKNGLKRKAINRN